MSNYWVLCANNNVKDVTALTELPKEIVLSQWLSGEEVTISEQKISIDEKTIVGGSPGDILYSDIAAYFIGFIEILKEFGIKNIQCQAMERLKEDGSVKESNYFFVNILGLKQCVNNYDINNPQTNGPELFDIDESKTDGLDIFRLAENPNLVIISNKLKEHIDTWETEYISIISTQEYVKAHTLQKDELALSKELSELTSKYNYSEEILARVEVLLQNGADANYKTSSWSSKSPLVQVLNCWDKVYKQDMLELLIKWGAEVNRPDDDKYPIKTAAHDGNINDVIFLMNNGAVDGFEDALSDAIEKNHIDIVKLFVEKGVDVNNPCALSVCSKTYHYKKKEENEGTVAGYDIAQYLISKGANVNGVGEFEGQPLRNAITFECIELVELFVKNSLNIFESEHLNLGLAKSVKMINCLVEIGFDPQRKDPQYQTTYLMDTIFWGEKALFKAFLKYDIDLYAVNYQGLTAFHYGIRSEKLAIVKYLLSIYDIKKVHAIKSVFGIADNPKIDALLKEALGLKNDTEEQCPLVRFNNPEFNHLKTLQDKARENLCSAQPDILTALTQLDLNHSKSVADALYKEMDINLANWRLALEPDTKLHAIDLEYAGASTDPFDGASLLNAYANYSVSKSEESVYTMSNPISELKEKGLSTQYYFDDIDQLLTDYPKESSHIRNYFRYHAFILLHGVFDTLNNAEKFSSLPHDESILIFGKEHDEDPVVIFKIA